MMRKKLSMVFIVAAAMGFMGCVSSRASMPEDFSLTFNWNTGTLPPQYRYEYVITLGPGLQGELDFMPGYDGAQGTQRWVTSFGFSQESIEKLYTFFNENDLLRLRWNTGRELIGGSTTQLIITAFGTQHRIPSISELEGKDRQLVEDAMDKVRALVPESVWAEMEERQTRFENGY